MPLKGKAMRPDEMQEDDIRDVLEQIGQSIPKAIFSFSDGTNGTEWNAAFHFASRLQEKFDSFDCDFDLSKVHEANKHFRPDIVLHKRGNHDHNFLAVEMKTWEQAKPIERDWDKIRTIWFQNYHYQFGATVILNVRHCSARVEQNPALRR